MKTALTIDSAGRVVLPSEARRLLNLRPGSRLRLHSTRRLARLHRRGMR
jgi:AbrB family looped-hinge helix DNA binding protein